MDDALLVGVIERLGDLMCHRQGLARGNRAARQSIGERIALDELQHKTSDTQAFARDGVFESVDRRYVRMVQ